MPSLTAAGGRSCADRRGGAAQPARRAGPREPGPDADGDAATLPGGGVPAGPGPGGGREPTQHDRTAAGPAAAGAGGGATDRGRIPRAGGDHRTGPGQGGSSRVRPGRPGRGGAVVDPVRGNVRTQRPEEPGRSGGRPHRPRRQPTRRGAECGPAALPSAAHHRRRLVPGSSGSPARPAPNCPRCSARWPHPGSSRSCTTIRPSPRWIPETHGQRLHDALEDVCDRLLPQHDGHPSRMPAVRRRR